jgi:hypothetical protein
MAGSQGTQRELRLRIWSNPTDPNSLSLTMEGYTFLAKTLGLKHYAYELTEPLSNGNILQLERHFPSVYFLFGKRKKILVFEEKEATMLSLYGGDLKQYLDSLSQ